MARLVEAKRHYTNLGERAPWTYIRYEDYRIAFEEGTILNRISRRYNLSPEAIKKLAEDPDHGGKITLSSIIETMVALELEQDGILGISVKRGPKRTDLEDGLTRLWDVKAPPRLDKIGFDMEAAIDSIVRKFDEFPDNNIGILLCVSFMTVDDYTDLLKTIKNDFSSERLFHIRQVIIEGCLVA